ncbi:hypothetical protein [Enterococcus malodoratus]|uniref:hypothetical protein n=1 Tax=Enterococcus malodoratus TaxID=71451 RepID=UPI0039B11776
MNIEAKYTLKKASWICYFLLLFIGFLLTIGRWLSVPIPDFVVINPEIHSHISNLSLSLIFYLGIGNTWLVTGVKFRSILILGVLLLFGNFVCETLMGFMNTADIMDAIYGTAGTIIGFTYLFFTYKYGLVPVRSAEKEVL